MFTKTRDNLKFISSVLFAVAILVGGIFVSSKNVLADGLIQITTVSELRSAIANQADGQIWNISAGDYGLDRFNDITVKGQAGWYFPITANNITIEGIGNPIIYGNEFSLNGNWSTQNLISVFGNNVTIKGLTLMPKAEGNKTIEVLGSDITIENVTIQPNTKIDGSVYNGITNDLDKAFSKEWGGSIYFSHIGNHMVKNVTINNGGISFRYSPSGTHVIFDNVNIVNKTAIDDINSYRYSSGFDNTDTSTTGLPKVTYKVDASTNNLASALLGAKDGDVIEFTSDITTTSQTDINKAITINGANHTLTTTSVGGSVIGINSNDVTIKNLIEDGNGDTGNNRGINIYKVTGILLDNVTASNNKKNGIVVNGSTVTVNNITTANNGWEGIDVDQGSGVTTLASLTVNGTSSHSEAKAAIRVDDTTKTPAPTVIDTKNQYSFSNPSGNIKDYVLDVTAPIITIDSYVTTLTNQDIVVTATTNEGTLNTSSHTFTVNGSFDFVATDAAGNVKTEKVTISNIDKTAPVITVSGTNPISVLQGSSYTDAGATATDDVDGVVTVNSSSFNTDTVGTFTITYTATDKAGNTATATREVTVSRRSNGGGGGGSSAATPATPATPAIPKIIPAVPATPAIPAIPKGKVLGAETYNFTKLMKKGLSGTEVMELQKFLNTLGFDCGTADGKFGQKTKNAVVKFQISKGLKGDGVVGAMTRAFLK